MWHFRPTRHLVIRSLEPGENWGWCYIDDLMMELSAYPVAAPS